MGDQLSRVAGEHDLFEIITQRQALCSELAQIRRRTASFVECVNNWKFVSEQLPSASAQAAFTEAVGRQDAWLLACKRLLAATHRALEAGCAGEIDIALLRTWLNMSAPAFDGFLALCNPPVAHQDNTAGHPSPSTPISSKPTCRTPAAIFSTGRPTRLSRAMCPR